MSKGNGSISEELRRWQIHSSDLTRFRAAVEQGAVRVLKERKSRKPKVNMEQSLWVRHASPFSACGTSLVNGTRSAIGTGSSTTKHRAMHASWWFANDTTRCASGRLRLRKYVRLWMKYGKIRKTGVYC